MSADTPTLVERLRQQALAHVEWTIIDEAAYRIEQLEELLASAIKISRANYINGSSPHQALLLWEKKASAVLGSAAFQEEKGK